MSPREHEQNAARCLALAEQLSDGPLKQSMIGMAAAWLATVQRAVGGLTEAAITADPKDRRFVDPAWKDNAWFFGLQQSYLVGSRLLLELIEAADLSEAAEIILQQ